ncbi:MAG: CDP-alcohol phosphatidyltransferase family protein [Clostridia bacterium]|nr:CDP-alcohol phosphatidyltransferase family protein [Clostridia bacterium]
MANIITISRIIGSVLLLFFPAFSIGFYIIYIACGVSDMIDGTIARKTKSASKLGAKIDTVADILFVTASLIKIVPAINIYVWLWIWGVAIAIIKVGNIVWGYVSKNEFMSLHSIMNKIAGLLLFLLPLTLSFIELKYSAIVICFMATLAAIQESVYIARISEKK